MRKKGGRKMREMVKIKIEKYGKKSFFGRVKENMVGCVFGK